jgi:phosphoserine phosphatase
MTTPIIASDMDGTLTTAETWRGVHAWIHTYHPSAAARRFVPLRLPAVFVARAGLVSKERFRAWWLESEAHLLRGTSADELTAMGEWVVEEFLWPARRLSAITALHSELTAARAVDPSVRLVLATGGYQPVGAAFARRINANLALGTPLEMRDGHATGRLAAPTQSGAEKAAAVERAAEGGTILVAFGDTAADIPLLRRARRAVAVAPDATLARIAAAEGWERID